MVAIVEGTNKPSSDTASHLVIYRARPDVHGVVHTHSRYATAFAAVGRPIPVYLTAQADEFGAEIPCADFAFIGDEAIGTLVVDGLGDSPAILLKQHGVFTVGPTAEAAVKTAVMVEDIAADRLGGPPDRHQHYPTKPTHSSTTTNQQKTNNKNTPPPLKQHGVFTVGPSAEAAVKTAVMVEDIAATVWAALQIGTPEPLPDDAVERLHRRYTTEYGQ